MRFIDGLAVFGDHTDGDPAVGQLRDVAASAIHVALMADGHLGYHFPVGGVAAYDNQVSVAGVGYDIGCGNCAIRTNLSPADLDLPALADAIAATFSFGIGRTEPTGPDVSALLADPAWSGVPTSHRRGLQQKADSQAGTIGGGNHYVDVFVDEEGFVWVGIHFGSRGLGHTIASGFMALAQGERWGERVPETEALLALDSELGSAYWGMMTVAGEYAHAGRDWVARRAVALMGGEVTDYVHNHHNFAWRETHALGNVVVVRKGATPAFPGQRGFVGGSMGDDAVILRGAERDDPERRASLYSTIHGAGRVMSRSQAKGSRDKVNKQTGERRPGRPGLVSREMMDEWTRGKGVIVRGGDVDEAPQVYRRLDEVVAAQGNTVEVEHTLRPLIVVMAGRDVFDPFKD
jgi:tRNA-splicing ligase RtcB